MAYMATETIFDHAVTPKEMDVILPMVISKDKWLKLGKSQNTEWGHIYHLYMLRRDPAKAKEYLAKITDPEYAENVSYSDIVA